VNLWERCEYYALFSICEKRKKNKNIKEVYNLSFVTSLHFSKLHLVKNKHLKKWNIVILYTNINSNLFTRLNLYNSLALSFFFLSPTKDVHWQLKPLVPDCFFLFWQFSVPVKLSKICNHRIFAGRVGVLFWLRLNCFGLT